MEKERTTREEEIKNEGSNNGHDIGETLSTTSS